MSKLLLLYDTNDRDFARDVAGLVQALDVDVEMIPRGPDGGTTLQQKEANYFEQVDGALFLITPGSERHGKQYPSPSVADEMGQAKERFKAEPWRVIYLVDSECSIQAVDQRAYIGFRRTDHRSMIEAVRLLVLGLKDSGLLAVQLPAAAPKPPEVDLQALIAGMSAQHRAILRALGSRPNGGMYHFEFVKLAADISGNATDGNLAVQDLYKLGVLGYTPPSHGLGGTDTAWLSPIGWGVVRVLRAQERSAADAPRAIPVVRSGSVARIVGPAEAGRPPWQ